MPEAFLFKENLQVETFGSLFTIAHRGQSNMNVLFERCLANTARLQQELRGQIEFIESGIEINVPAGEMDELKTKLAELDALIKQYAPLFLHDLEGLVGSFSSAADAFCHGGHGYACPSASKMMPAGIRSNSVG